MQIKKHVIVVSLVIAFTGLYGCDNDNNNSEPVENPDDDMQVEVGDLNELATLGDVDESGLLDIEPMEQQLLSLSADDPAEFDDADTVSSVLNRIGTR